MHRELKLVPQGIDESPLSTQFRTMEAQEKEATPTSFGKEDDVKNLIVDQGALLALSNSLNDAQKEGDLILLS